MAMASSSSPPSSLEESNKISPSKKKGSSFFEIVGSEERLSCCGIAGCNVESERLSFATYKELQCFGIKNRMAIVKICGGCKKKAEQYKKKSMQAFHKVNSVTPVVHHLESDKRHNGGGNYDRTVEDSDMPRRDAKAEEVEKYDRKEVDIIVQNIMNRFNIQGQMAKCEDHVDKLDREFKELGKMMKEVDDKLYEANRLYNGVIDKRPRPVVIKEVEIDADGSVQELTIQNDDSVFVNHPESLRKLVSLTHKSPEDEAPGTSAEAANKLEDLNQSIIRKPVLSTRKPGPASKTKYYEALDARRCEHIDKTIEQPPELLQENGSSKILQENGSPGIRQKNRSPKTPTLAIIHRTMPKAGDVIYAMNKSLLHFWLKAEILELVYNDATNQTEFIVIYEPTRNGQPTGGDKGEDTVSLKRQICLKMMAYTISCPYPLPVGIRVIAKYKDKLVTDPECDDRFYAGIVAEPPKLSTKNRYLIFFDDGNAQYVFQDDVYLVCESSQHVWNDLYPDSYDFVKSYLAKWPNFPMVTLRVGSLVPTEWNGRWFVSRVLEVDNSLAKVRFENDGRVEWIYRGSARFCPDSDVCIEFQGSLSKIKIPVSAPKPKYFVQHLCGPWCVIPFEASNELKRISPLAIPMFFGWQREVARTPRRTVFYRSPCGARFRDVDELSNYLDMTNCNLSMDQFCFQYAVDCFSEFVPARSLMNINDISYGKEGVPVQYVNSLDHDAPAFMEYTPGRVFGPDVELDTDKNFLVCCDCTDNCQDKSKCACWKLTHEGISFTKLNDENDPTVGYEHRRLKDHFVSGIYECNSRCSCRQTCSNRVVQNGVQWPLQLFKTTNKGVGIRALFDMPEGSFICIYSGEILNDDAAEGTGKEFGDEYLAALDYIECNEDAKEGFESDVTDIEEDDDNITNGQGMGSPKKKRVNGRSPFLGDVGRKRKFAMRRTTVQKKQLKPSSSPDNDYDMITTRTSSSSSNVTPSSGRKLRRVKTRDLYGENEQLYIMDAKSKGNIGRYLNHSCTPNVFVQNVFVDSHDLRFPLVAFFTKIHVKAGSELTWDYKYEVDSVPGKVMYCFCMSPYCKGRLL